MYHPRLRGSHYDNGLKLGKILKNRNVDFNEINRLDDFQTDFGKKSQIILSRVFPEACEEIRGLTDGLDCPYEKLASWLLCLGCCYDPIGCTAFCFIHNHDVFYGRNNDLPPFLRKGSKSILYKLKDGYPFIGNTSSMINVEEGLNACGLAVAMTVLVPAVIVPGMSALFLVRYLLEKCATTKDATHVLQRLPIASACNIILADKEGDMAVAECTPEEVLIRRPGTDENFIVAANQFASDEMKHHHAGDWNIFRSDTRYKTAYKALKKGCDIDALDFAKGILGGKYGFMCQYDRKLNFDTIWSSVFDISNNKIYRAEGNPSRAGFKEDIRCSQLWMVR